jgi:predicted DNA-binding antitoxin AbrB/MazE fold protein
MLKVGKWSYRSNRRLASPVWGISFYRMSTTVEAIYENGVLRLLAPLPLPEKAHVTVTIQASASRDDNERSAWLKLSEASLLKTWENPDDDVFNELQK